MLLLNLKAKLIALGAALLAALAFVLRFQQVKGQRDRARLRADKADQTVKLAKKVREREVQEREQVVSRRAEAKKEIESEGTSSELSDPNSDWV